MRNMCIISEIPIADSIRGTLEVELKNGVFTGTLTDKTTKDYTTLKSTVVNAVGFT